MPPAAERISSLFVRWLGRQGTGSKEAVMPSAQYYREQADLLRRLARTSYRHRRFARRRPVTPPFLRFRSSASRIRIEPAARGISHGTG
jgi:hypothetical protein